MCYSHARRLCYVLQRLLSAIFSHRSLYLAKKSRAARAGALIKAGGAKPSAVPCVMCYGANTGHNTVLCVTKMLPMAKHYVMCYAMVGHNTVRG